MDILRTLRSHSGGRSLIAPAEMRRPLPRLAYCGICLALGAWALTTAFPLYWMVVSALKPTAEMYRIPPTLLPLHPDFGTVAAMWEAFDFPLYFRNSLAIAAGTVVLNLGVSSLAGYALAKLRPPGGRALLFLFLCTLMVPSQAYLIPQFLNIKSLPLLGWSLMDTYWAVWLPGAVSAFHIFMFKSFFHNLPDELLEAARIDGASALQAFLRVALPLARPALAVAAIFVFTASWNDFLWPLLVIPTEERQPLMVALYYLSKVADKPHNLVMAAMATAAAVPIAVFLIFQRHIVRGIAVGGLKG